MKTAQRSVRMGSGDQETRPVEERATLPFRSVAAIYRSTYYDPDSASFDEAPTSVAIDIISDESVPSGELVTA